MSDTLAQYDFELPRESIAQAPVEPRDSARMMVLRRGGEELRHQVFRELPRLLPPGALVVINDTRVMPVRLSGQLPGGTPLEALLVEQVAPGRWEAMVKKARRLKPGMQVPFAGGRLMARAEQRTEQGRWILSFGETDDFLQRLEEHGLAPLPPYITRNVHDEDYDPRPDKAAYQTCYASRRGAIAAPTAGLHFTERILEEIHQGGMEIVRLTLHVGAGTFSPVKTDDPALHQMHREWYEIPGSSAKSILEAKSQGRPVIAVGTTTVRALESWAGEGGRQGVSGWSDIFIRPPYEFKMVDGLLTNFHLPRSTLLMLVSAFHGRQPTIKAYDCAVRMSYRFYSFGDCMLILPREPAG
ncbi:MAG: tRNA preQ1(34) S-adenosylmethionine ribosyltransferase-isomerase QueA [Deltaproteobacteria bacterium]|nr:tRNA preQ1(34) S-adenosylmethionine ribosyltransferase-isomerase QueA [Deltaproteobacteria bacterium]